MANQKAIQYSVALALSLLLFIIGYKLQRHETQWLIVSYSILFSLYAWIILKNKIEQVHFWIAAAIGFRFLLLFSVPNLSDDFYRFIWDGRLLASGHHSFSHIPSFYIENNLSIPGIDEALYSKLNSKAYFTIYPPVSQFLFFLCAKLSPTIEGSLLILKIIILVTETGSIFLLTSLLKQFNLSKQNVLLYALNPLVIIELAGNAHFEGIVIFFVLLSCYFLTKGRLLLAGIFLAISICVKLVPLIFLPAILPLLGWKKALLFYSSTALACVLIFLPMLDTDIIMGFKNSIGYYFSKFEFNASIYYLVKGLGYLFWGYNIIQTAGWILGVFAGLLILMTALKWPMVSQWATIDGNKPSNMDERLGMFFHSMMWSLLIYFLFTTTLHPWYIITILAITVFTGFRFVILWTFTIFLSYAGYTSEGYVENLWIVAFEYVIVLGYLAFELLWKKRRFSSLV